MKWILIMAIHTGSGGLGATAEFNSEVACQEARTLILEALEGRNEYLNRRFSKQIICVPKGESEEQEGGK